MWLGGNPLNIFLSENRGKFLIRRCKNPKNIDLFVDDKLFAHSKLLSSNTFESEIYIFKVDDKYKFDKNFKDEDIIRKMEFTLSISLEINQKRKRESDFYKLVQNKVRFVDKNIKQNLLYFVPYTTFHTYSKIEKTNEIKNVKDFFINENIIGKLNFFTKLKNESEFLDGLINSHQKFKRIKPILYVLPGFSDWELMNSLENSLYGAKKLKKFVNTVRILKDVVEMKIKPFISMTFDDFLSEISSERDKMDFLFTHIINLYIANFILKIEHNDIHTGNILIQKHTKPKLFSINVGNKIYSRKIKYQAVLIDFSPDIFSPIINTDNYLKIILTESLDITDFCSIEETTKKMRSSVGEKILKHILTYQTKHKIFKIENFFQSIFEMF